jgi:hypothetical protein
VLVLGVFLKLLEGCLSFGSFSYPAIEVLCW